MTLKSSATRLIGILIVGTWAVMLGFLVRKTHFPSVPLNASAKDTLSPAREAEREWLEIYLKGKKIGYAVNQIRPLGEEGHLIQDEMFMRLSLLGVPSQVHALTQCAVDRDFLLRNFRFTMTSGAVAFHAMGTVEGDWLRVDTGRGRDRRTTRIRLSAPIMLSSGISRFLRMQARQEGETYRVPIFDPSTLSQAEALLHVRGKGLVEINRVSHSATRVDAEVLGQRMTLWLDEKGAVLKEEGFLGLTLVKTSSASAGRALEGGEGTDLYELAAVPVEKRIRDPRRVAYLQLRAEGLEGFPQEEGMSGGRQRYREGILEVTRETLPAQVKFAASEASPSSERTAYLSPEAGIESDAEEVVRRAREIGRGIEDRVVLAKRLMSWVYEKVEKRPVLSVPSAREVLGTLVGDCNEHAVLLTALLRASGIPARVCVGLVLIRNKFYYHAWTEAYLGEWVSMDPTLNQMPADATHVKLAQGGLDRQVEIIRLLGRIRLEVLAYRYD